MFSTRSGRIMWLALCNCLLMVGFKLTAAWHVPSFAVGISRRGPPVTLTTLSASSSSSSSNTVATAQQEWIVQELIGSGSYGTVHLLTSSDKSESSNTKDDDPSHFINAHRIAKRPWTLEELQEQQQSTSSSSSRPSDQTNKENEPADKDYLGSKAKRCQSYWNVEVHCLQKLPPHACLPAFGGVLELEQDTQKHSWMVMECILGNPPMNKETESQSSIRNKIAPTLQDLFDQEHKDRSNPDNNTNAVASNGWMLKRLATALGLTVPDMDNNDASLTIHLQVVDRIVSDLLQAMVHFHDHNIVHRDLKPANLLVTPEPQRSSLLLSLSPDTAAAAGTTSQLVVLDFGSAGDLDTAGMLSSKVGLSDRDRVAISPIYTAPEIFIDPGRPAQALAFDCFSAALIICQVLFQFVDERTDAGFHQQLQSADYQLDIWLQSTLQSKVTPVGLETALEVLQRRPGLWKLLQDMLTEDPRDRISSSKASKRWKEIMEHGRRLESMELETLDQIATALQEKLVHQDGPYLREVLESLQTCLIPNTEPSRPLHFVATFKRGQSLGLILSEASSGDEEDPEDDLENKDDRALWEQATQDALPGEVFVKGIVENGQAETMGIFEIGDRLQGVGELPLAEGGFERAVEMIQDQPKSAKTVTLHFDRKSAIGGQVYTESTFASASEAMDAPMQIVDQGAWSIRGRRAAQEDAFILHEVHDTRQRAILLAGVMDGHLGRAASEYVKDHLPQTFSDELLALQENLPVGELLEATWTDICDGYRAECNGSEECAAEYDAREGVLMANTGSSDAVAGTTATLLAFDLQTSQIAALNCGDSRSILLDSEGGVKFQTVDHSPGNPNEVDRFEEGRRQGLGYSIPECRFSKWVVPVGEYVYAVSRSLEGSFATSKGIVSDADISVVRAAPGMTSISASDGFWEVIDSSEAARIVAKLRSQQAMSAGDAAKTLCSLAYERGSSDNVSVVVMYL